MRSVGEAMAIGRTFKQAFAKALRSRELDKQPLVADLGDQELLQAVATPGPERYEGLLELLRRDVELEPVRAATMIDPWFLRELRELARDPGSRRARASARSARSTPAPPSSRPAPPTTTPAGSAAGASEVDRGERESVVILGAGPNRIGQGIEFDYCCVHAAMTVRDSGRDAVMINCNPETVSTDYDTSDRLYFEPLTLEDVLAVVELEQPLGVIVQFGGQTPLKLASGLERAGVPLLGTSVEAIDLAEDRGRFGALLDELGYKAPPYAAAALGGAGAGQRRVGRLPAARAPLLRPRGAGDGDRLLARGPGRLPAPRGRETAGKIYLDRFLEDSLEVDVDALCDRNQVWIGGIMQHVEEAGVHSGDSACVLPPHSLGEEMLDQIRAATRDIALAIGVVGLLNVQFAIHAGELYVIEANPRASRTVPFVSKAVGRAAGEARLPDHARRDDRVLRAAEASARGSGSAATCRSRRRCCRSTASRDPTRCSVRRCAPPAR